MNQLTNTVRLEIKDQIGIIITKGKLTKEDANQRMSLINGTVDYEPIKDVNIVVEAISEDINFKDVFSKLDLICKKDAIFATTTE